MSYFNIHSIDSLVFEIEHNMLVYSIILLPPNQRYNGVANNPPPITGKPSKTQLINI